MNECGEASAVSVEGDRFAILIVVQKGLWCGGPLAGAADWFRQYLDTKHRSLSRSHSTLAMIAQMQPPSFNRSTRSSGARKLTDNFYGFSQHAVLRQIHHSA